MCSCSRRSGSSRFSTCRCVSVRRAERRSRCRSSTRRSPSSTRWPPSSRPASPMRARDPLAALAFLTRIPVGRWVALGADDVGRGVAFFPVVGAAVGALAGLAAEGLDGPLPALVAGGLGVAAALVLTGALHLDGLADTADAFGSGDRPRRLEIMRDSRIGSFGAAAIALAVLVEAAALGG